MGIETSRPDTVRFNLQTAHGTVTIIAKKIVKTLEKTDRELFHLADEEKIIKRLIESRATSPAMRRHDVEAFDMNWHEVTLTMYPVRAKIAKTTRKLETVASMEFVNDSGKPAEYSWTVDRSKLQRQTVSRKWYAENELKSNVEIACKILTLGSVHFSRKTIQTNDTKQSETLKLSSKGEVKVPVGPKQAVLMKLEAIFHSVDIEVEYEAKLEGIFRYMYKTAMFANDGFQDTNKLLKMYGNRDTATYKEIITLNYYTDADKITMTDIDTSSNTWSAWLKNIWGS